MPLTCAMQSMEAAKQPRLMSYSDTLHKQVSAGTDTALQHTAHTCPSPCPTTAAAHECRARLSMQRAADTGLTPRLRERCGGTHQGEDRGERDGGRKVEGGAEGGV